jgi:hypothetical protein
MSGMMRRAMALLFVAAACGPGAPGGPMSGRVQQDVEAAPDIQSNDVLNREPVTNRAQVKHVLLSWDDLAPLYKGGQDRRGKARTREQADQLATSLLEQIRAGADIDKLMREWSEDQGSAAGATSYEVKPDSQYVFEFRRLALRLNIGEVGLVKSVYGWHVMKRIE